MTQGHRLGKKTTEKHLEKRSGEGSVDSRLQVYLEEDGDGSTRQSGMETSGQWPMIQWELQGMSSQVPQCEALRFAGGKISWVSG